MSAPLEGRHPGYAVFEAVFAVALLAVLVIFVVKISSDREDCLAAGGTFILSALPPDRYCVSDEAVIDP